MLNQPAQKSLFASAVQRLRSAFVHKTGGVAFSSCGAAAYVKLNGSSPDEDVTCSFGRDYSVDALARVLSIDGIEEGALRSSMWPGSNSTESEAPVMEFGTSVSQAGNPSPRLWPQFTQMPTGFVLCPMIMPVSVGPFGMANFWSGSVNVATYIPVCALAQAASNDDSGTCAGLEDRMLANEKWASSSLESNTASDFTAQSSSDESTTFWPATPESTPPQSPRAGFQHAATTLSAADVIDEEGILVRLAGDDARERHTALAWVTEQAWSLANTAPGCRVIQAAIDVADPSEQAALLAEFRGHVVEASASPHANFVIQKCIVAMPTERVRFILKELRGHAIAAAKNRSSCRVLQRLIEHCSAEQTGEVVAEILRDAEKLSRHVFGNFVIQHILEHGTMEQQAHIATVLSQDVVRLAKHKVASHVVKCAFIHCGPQETKLLVNALTMDKDALAEVARHNCGSFVMREMKRANATANHRGT